MPETSPSVPESGGPAVTSGSVHSATAGGPSSLRRDLLLRLRLDGPSSPDQLAARLGASRTGVLQQLRALEAAHLVSRQTVRHGVGRPRHLYDVTADAQDLFPSTYDALAAGLLAAIGAVGGDDLLDEVFAARRRPARRPCPRQARGASPRRCTAPGPGDGARGHPGRAGLSRRGVGRRRRHDPAARAQLRDLPRRPARRRRPARPSSNCSARSWARTSCARRTSPRAIAAAATRHRGARRRLSRGEGLTPPRVRRPCGGLVRGAARGRPRRSARTMPRATSRRPPPGPPRTGSPGVRAGPSRRGCTS